MILNKTTKISPFEVHFVRNPNTKLSNILTKSNLKKLNYRNLKNYCLVKRNMKKPVLKQEGLWRLDGTREDELDIQHLDSPPRRVMSADYQLSQDSNEQPVVAKSSKINSSEIIFPIGDKNNIVKTIRNPFSVGDKTTKLIYIKNNVARKLTARKAKEPSPTLALLSNIKQNGTITDY